MMFGVYIPALTTFPFRRMGINVNGQVKIFFTMLFSSRWLSLINLKFLKFTFCLIENSIIFAVKAVRPSSAMRGNNLVETDEMPSNSISLDLHKTNWNEYKLLDS